MIKKALTSLFLAAATLAGTANAAIVIADFDDLEFVNNSINGVGSVIEEDGLVFEAPTSSFNVLGTQAITYAGSPAIYNDQATALTTVTLESGGTFDAISIDLSEVSFAAATIEFTGIKDDLSEVTSIFTTDGVIASAETYNFSSAFNNLTSLNIVATTNLAQIDNFTANVTAVPEPATTALLAGGLAAVGVAMHRRRKMAALNPHPRAAAAAEKQIPIS